MSEIWGHLRILDSIDWKPTLATAARVLIILVLAAIAISVINPTGFFILVENQIRQRDYVEVAGKTGLVEEITLRRVRMRDYDGTVYFVPNNLITTVANLSRDFAYAVIDVTAGLRDNVDETIEVMLKVGRELRADSYWGSLILADLEMAGVKKWGDSSILLRGRLMTQPLKQGEVRREYLRRLKAALDGLRQDGSAPAMVSKTPQLSPPSAAS